MGQHGDSVSAEGTFNRGLNYYTFYAAIDYYGTVFWLNVDPYTGDAICTAAGQYYIYAEFSMNGTILLDEDFLNNSYTGNNSLQLTAPEKNDMVLCAEICAIYPSEKIDLLRFIESKNKYLCSSNYFYPTDNIGIYNSDSNIEKTTFYTICRKSRTNNSVDVFLCVTSTTPSQWAGNAEFTGLTYNPNYEKHYNYNKGKESIKESVSFRHSIERLKEEYPNCSFNLIVTGHSRGGAVANLYAKEATDKLNGFTFDDIPTFDSITAYTFGSPNVAISNSFNDYSNIINVCFYEDVVSNLPIGGKNDWYYGKYGINIKASVTALESNVKPDMSDDIIDNFDYWKSVSDYYNKTLTNNYNQTQTTLFQFVHNTLESQNYAHAFLEALNYKRLGRAFVLPIWYYGEIKVSHKLANYIDAVKTIEFIPDTTQSRTQQNDIREKNINKRNIIYDTYQKQKIISFITNNNNNSILNWDIDSPESWNGIVWSNDGYIKSIDLQYYDLTGTLDLTDFGSLEVLNVRGNNISGVILNGCTNLESINVSDNSIINLTVADCTNLENLDCSLNDLSTNGLSVSLNTDLKSLMCDGCGLTSISIDSLTSLEELSCAYNKLTTIDFDDNTELTSLVCCYNYLDIHEGGILYNKLNNLMFNDVYVNYYPQSIPDNAAFNTNELNTLEGFALMSDNNDELDWLDQNDNIDIDKLQNNVQFEYDGSSYRVVSIDVSNKEIEGTLNLNSFSKLCDLYCSNTNIASLTLTNCIKLKTLYCDNSNLSVLNLPSNAGTKTTQLYDVSCENNHIDINIFTTDIVKFTMLKAGATLKYKHQLINGQVSDFDNNDYTALTNLYNQLDNSDILDWDTTTPGYFDCVDWKYDSVSGKYKLLDVYFDGLDIKGNVDFCSSTEIDKISFSGSKINTVIVPEVNILADAFYDCSYLEAVILSNGTTSIGEEAFKHCDVLQGVYIPSSVTTIDSTAFDDCDSITLAGVSNSTAESFAQTNSIPFEAGFFACGKVVVKETSNGGHSGNYPVEGATVSDGSNDYDTDKYGYYVFFGLSNGSNTLDLTYPYGWDMTINASISNASIIITAPIPMVVCDYNSDGYINGRDYANFLTANVQPGDTNFKYYDINKDGVKNSSDWQVVWGLIGDQRPSNRSNNDSEQPNNDSTDNSSENSSPSGIENLNGDDD